MKETATLMDDIKAIMKTKSVWTTRLSKPIATLLYREYYTKSVLSYSQSGKHRLIFKDGSYCTFSPKEKDVHLYFKRGG